MTLQTPTTPSSSAITTDTDGTSRNDTRKYVAIAPNASRRGYAKLVTPPRLTIYGV